MAHTHDHSHDHGSSHDHGPSHDHGHDHDHAKTFRPDIPDGLTYYKKLEIAVRELLIAKGIITSDEVRQAIEAMDRRSPEGGAKVTARAWLDPAFKERLLANGTKTVEELGIEMGPTKLVVVENTDEVHNVVVCTLCSCYPRMLLGIPPDWYKQRAYRSRVVREPRTVLKEFGTEIDDSRTVRVHDSTADMRYMVLPKRPLGTDGLSEEELAGLVGRDAMIGVTEVEASNS